MGIMNFFKRPSKRIRLDAANNVGVNVCNEDLWGQDDLTAEEFDMLEVQATQDHTYSFHQPVPKPSNTDSFQVDTAIQYELEGKVKILNDSLEKLKKELAEEKLMKEKIVAEKVKEFEQKEKCLQKEIEKMQSSLQFKDQEMKTVYDKVKVLEMNLKSGKINKDIPNHRSPNKISEKFNFKSGVSVQTSETQQHHNVISSRKYSLNLDTQRGKIRGSDMVSSMLCNRLISTTPTSLFLTQTETAVCEKRSELSAVSVTRLNLEQETEDIFHYTFSVLKNFLFNLESLACKASSITNSPKSLRKKDCYHDRAVVVSCLKDLSYIVSCCSFSETVSKFETQSHIIEAKRKDFSKSSESTTSTSLLITSDTKQEKEIHFLIKLLFNLSNPNIYPNGCIKTEEIEWSLTALVSWSAADVESVLEYFDEKIIANHITNSYSITASCIVLKLLINICSHKKYLSKLIHSNDLCHICAVSMLLCKISESALDCINLMIMVEDFLSSIFAVYTFSEIRLGNAPCSVILLRSFLLSFWNFFPLKKDCHDVSLILKKGFTLLHYLAKYIPNFKEKRNDFEDLYISIVCQMLMLSKENPIFKDFYELAHELWDFQEDVSEFDFEETSDDSMQTTNLLSQS